MSEIDEGSTSMPPCTEAEFRLVFERLFPLAARMLLGMFRTYSSSEHRIEDAESKLISAFASELDRRNQGGEFREFRNERDLARAFARIAYNRFRRKRDRSKEVTGLVEGPLASSIVPPEIDVLQDEYRQQLQAVRDRVLSALHEVNPRYAEIVGLYLKMEGDTTQKEIANLLGVSQGTVCRALRYFRDLIQQELDKLANEDEE